MFSSFPPLEAGLHTDKLLSNDERIIWSSGGDYFALLDVQVIFLSLLSCFTRGEILKFFLKFFSLQERFSPLAGIKRWNFSEFNIFHPPTLFALLFCSQQKPSQSGKENSCKLLDFVQNFIIWKFAKIELNNPAFGGG